MANTTDDMVCMFYLRRSSQSVHIEIPLYTRFMTPYFLTTLNAMPFSTFEAASPITNSARKTADQFGYHQANGSFTGRQISVDPKSLLRRQQPPSTDVVGVPRVQLKPVVAKQRTNCMCSPLHLKCLCAGPSSSASPRCNSCLGKKKQRNQLAVSHRKANNSPERHQTGTLKSKCLCAGPSKSSNSSPRCNPCLGKKKQRNQLAVSHQKANNSSDSHQTGTLKSKCLCAGPSNSANSSPRCNLCLGKKKQRNQLAVSHQKANNSPDSHHTGTLKSKFICAGPSKSASSSPRCNPCLGKKKQRNQLAVSPRKANKSPDSHHTGIICAGPSKSASSSPRFIKCLSKRKQRNQLAVSPRKANKSPERHHSPVSPWKANKSPERHHSPVYSAVRQESYMSRSESCEKHISVDPTSMLQEPTTDMGVPRVQLKPVVAKQKTKCMCSSLPLISPSLKCLCGDLSKSANSSPRFNKCLVKRKQRNQLAVPPRKANNSPERHHSRVQTVARQESYSSGSKSYGEGRLSAPSDESDLSASKLNSLKESSTNKKPEAQKDAKKPDESFRCGKMCVFLPGFGKAKPARPTRKQVMEVPTTISKRVSMEMFECESWSSSNDNVDSVNLYFDLPLEMIRTTVNDANFPVTAAFVFDDDDDHKGVLKNGNARAGSGARKSSEVGRNVRFSTSKPQTFPESPVTRVTPRLRKPRDEFSAFLEVQGAS